MKDWTISLVSSDFQAQPYSLVAEKTVKIDDGLMHLASQSVRHLATYKGRKEGRKEEREGGREEEQHKKEK